MKMLFGQLAAVSDSPIAWGLLALLAGFALVSLWNWYRCPYLCRSRAISQEDARAALERPFAAGPGFLLIMLAGIGATLGGLTLIAEGIRPALAFVLLLAGVFVMQTAPARLALSESTLRVIAAEPEGPEAQAAARSRLASSHFWLVAVNFVLVAAASALLVSL